MEDAESGGLVDGAEVSFGLFGPGYALPRRY